jgi:magnesium-transporting ATPase (P-type)
MDHDQNRAARTSWKSFAGLTLTGLLIAFLIFVVSAMGECLPRDGSTHMQVCDGEKRRFFRLYPTVVFSIVIVSAWLQAAGIRWARVLALFSGLVGIAAMWILLSLIG